MTETQWITFAVVTAVINFVALLTYPTSGQGTVLKFKAPNLTDEENHGKFMPDNLMCDTCRAVAHQVYIKFDTFNKHHKNYKHKPPESEIIELMESACSHDVYESYGVKTVDGKNRLHGPGVKGTENVPGMTSGGGRWPGRVSEICWRFVDRIGEEKIYEAFRKRRGSSYMFFEYLCKGDASEGRNSCLPQDSNKEEL